MKAEDLKLDKRFLEQVICKGELFVTRMASDLQDIKSGTLFDKVAAFNRVTNILMQHQHFSQMQTVTSYLGLFAKELGATDDQFELTLDGHPIFLDHKKSEEKNDSRESLTDMLDNLINSLEKASKCNHD